PIICVGRFNHQNHSGERFDPISLSNTIHDYQVFRPRRLIDGPYTSYDLNTLLKATAGERRAVVIGK
ncbi:hypothetical protein ACJX0J_041245, partial [Zea mays]